MRWVFAALSLCACDRVFGLDGRTDPVDDATNADGPSRSDSTIDAPPPHDEDGDGFDDLDDNCPGHANAGQGDNDVDGIGDVCDPLDERTKPNHRLLFDPFVTLNASWTPNTEWNANNDTVGPVPDQPHTDGFRLTHKVVEIAAGSRWQIDVGMQLPGMTSVAQFIGIHPTNVGSQSLWTCAVYWDGEWKVTAGANAIPTSVPQPTTILRTIGNGAAADTTTCTVIGGATATAPLNSIPYPLIPQIFSQIAIRYTFIDVIQ